MNIQQVEMQCEDILTKFVYETFCRIILKTLLQYINPQFCISKRSIHRDWMAEDISVLKIQI